jgi:hypothetical protein
MLRPAIFASLVAMICLGFIANAPADPAPDAIHAALLRQYPKGTFNETAVLQLNGVEVHDFEVDTPNGKTFARLTPIGDFLISGRHIKGALPPPVEHVIHQMLRTPPTHVQRFTTTRYLVDVQTNGKTDRLVFDAVGRLRDFKTAGELLHGSDVGPNVDDPTIRDGLTKLIAAEYGAGAAIQTITHFPDADNFYELQITSAAGRPVHVVADDKEVYISRTQIDPDKLPGHVQKAIAAMFNTDKILAAYRRKMDYFQFEQTAPDGHTLKFKVAGDGIVESVVDENEKAEETVTPG